MNQSLNSFQKGEGKHNFDSALKNSSGMMAKASTMMTVDEQKFQRQSSQTSELMDLKHGTKSENSYQSVELKDDKKEQEK